MKIFRLPINILLDGTYESDGAYVDEAIDSISPLFLKKFYRVGVSWQHDEILFAEKASVVKKFHQLLAKPEFSQVCDSLMHKDICADIETHYPIIEAVFELYCLGKKDIYYINSVDILWDEFIKFKEETIEVCSEYKQLDTLLQEVTVGKKIRIGFHTITKKEEMFTVFDGKKKFVVLKEGVFHKGNPATEKNLSDVDFAIGILRMIINTLAKRKEIMMKENNNAISKR